MVTWTMPPVAWVASLSATASVVMLMDLQDSCIEHDEVDLESEPALRCGLMATIDRLNDRYLRGTLVLASAGLKSKERTWIMKQNLLTPQYTTCWEDLPVAKA